MAYGSIDQPDPTPVNDICQSHCDPITLDSGGSSQGEFPLPKTRKRGGPATYQTISDLGEQYKEVLDCFQKSFFSPAHFRDSATESVSYPRLRIFSRPHKEGAIRGYDYFVRHRDTPKECEHWYKVKPVSLDTYLRRIHRGRTWTLLTYWFEEDGMYMPSFVQFDLDNKSADPAKVNEFWRRVGIFKNLERAGLVSTLWTTSPGDLIDGEHRHGLYAHIKITPRAATQIHEVVMETLDYLGLRDPHDPKSGVEFNYDKDARLTRMVGPNVWACEVDDQTRSVIVLPPDQQFMDDYRAAHRSTRHEAIERLGYFMTFCKRWKDLPTTDLDHLRTRVELASPVPSSQALPSTTQAQPTATTPKQAKQKFRKPIKMTKVTTQRLLSMENTFDATIISGIIQSLIRQRRGDQAQRDGIVQSAMAMVPCIRPSDSRTCNNENQLRAMTGRITDHYLRTYDPGKHRTLDPIKEDGDVRRFSMSKRVSPYALYRHIKHVQLDGERVRVPNDVRSILYHIHHECIKRNGRVAATRLYELCGSRRGYERVRPFLFAIYEPLMLYPRNHTYSVTLHHCRQFVLRPRFQSLAKKEEQRQKKVLTPTSSLSRGTPKPATGGRVKTGQSG